MVEGLTVWTYKCVIGVLPRLWYGHSEFWWKRDTSQMLLLNAQLLETTLQIEPSIQFVVFCGNYRRDDSNNTSSVKYNSVNGICENRWIVKGLRLYVKFAIFPKRHEMINSSAIFYVFVMNFESWLIVLSQHPCDLLSRSCTNGLFKHTKKVYI